MKSGGEVLLWILKSIVRIVSGWYIDDNIGNENNGREWNGCKDIVQLIFAMTWLEISARRTFRESIHREQGRWQLKMTLEICLL